MRRIVIDTDPGIDDALALLYAFASDEVAVEAITIVAGNVDVAAGTRNAFEILRIAGKSCVVAPGCDSPLTRPLETAAHVHGEDGLGGWTATGNASHQHPTAELDGPDTILHAGRRYPGEATLIALGPLTNVATALRRDPQAFAMLRDIVFMGGAVWAPGNVTATAEFNIYADPEAAREVVHSGVSLHMVGLDVTTKVPLTAQDLDDWLGSRTDERAQFLRTICGQVFALYSRTIGWNGCYMHDPLAVAVAINPALVTTQRMKVDVETGGELTRGTTVAERRAWVRCGENVDVCTAVDAESFRSQFRHRVIERR